MRAMNTMQDRVVCATSDKTVAVEVVRLDSHLKYKLHVRKKWYQAHDSRDQFKVGDFVQLQKRRPISKTKTSLPIPIPEKSQVGRSLGFLWSRSSNNGLDQSM